jgi:hypothetical protein
MRKKMKRIADAMKALILLIVFLGITLVVCGQPQPGKNGDGSDTDGEPLSGSAPIGSGLTVLLILGAGYAAKKVYNAGKKPERDEKEELS